MSDGVAHPNGPSRSEEKRGEKEQGDLGLGMGRRRDDYCRGRRSSESVCEKESKATGEVVGTRLNWSKSRERETE